MNWEPEYSSDASKEQQRSIHVSSLWIGLGLGIVYLFVGFWKTIGFLIFFGLGYLLSHSTIREKIVKPIWNGLLGKWDGQRKRR
jgi:uncharacterized membrane protein